MFRIWIPDPPLVGQVETTPQTDRHSGLRRRLAMARMTKL